MVSITDEVLIIFIKGGQNGKQLMITRGLHRPLSCTVRHLFTRSASRSIREAPKPLPQVADEAPVILYFQTLSIVNN